MERRAFTKPFGKLIKNKEEHLTFLPNNLPPSIKYDEGLSALISEASVQLGTLSGIGKLMPNPQLLIRPYLNREAVLSSKIEGTQASIQDIFRYMAGGMPERKERESKRVVEVVNYMHALEMCLHDVRKGAPIDRQMFKKAHRKLLQGVRGEELRPGEFRVVQNWIGKEGTTIEDATYVPPPTEYVNQLLGDLERFIQHPPGRIPVLVQCAMIHYMFEAIHPFHDGNGRIGRLLIPVLLAQRKLLDQPLLYLSAYLDNRKSEYYSLLLSVSQKNTWMEWIRFFLLGVIAQADDAVDNIRQLMALKAKYEQKLISRRASGSVTRLMEYFFSNPIISVPLASDHLQLTYPAAKNALESLKEMGILIEGNDKRRGKLFVAHEIMSVLR